ncbi:MAG: hypothetical protein P9E88_06360 [Candidatus Competibacter sp.]|nr:hypothetical protein [Candidatus Competibacter sp.]
MNPFPDGYTLQSVAASACPHADARQAAAIAEACFQSARDPTQMPIDDATVAWLLDTVPAYWNLIKYQGVVIGSTLILAYSTGNWTGIPRETGHPFQAKLDRDSTGNWTSEVAKRRAG